MAVAKLRTVTLSLKHVYSETVFRHESSVQPMFRETADDMGGRRRTGYADGSEPSRRVEMSDRAAGIGRRLKT